MTLQRLVIFLLGAPFASLVAAQPPVVSYPVTYPIDYRGHYLTQNEADQIVSVITSIHGIDHRVRLISVKSAADIEVHTGPHFGDPAGDTVHLWKREGKWSVVRRSKGSGF